MNIELLNEYLSGKMTQIKRHVVTKADGEIVYNVAGTKDEVPPQGYATFRNFWEGKSNHEPVTTCVAEVDHTTADGDDADVEAIDGAHVRLDGVDCPDDEAWIVPLCKKCNNDDNAEPIRLPKGMVLVPVKMAKPHATVKKINEDRMQTYVNQYERLFGK